MATYNGSYRLRRGDGMCSRARMTWFLLAFWLFAALLVPPALYVSNEAEFITYTLGKRIVRLGTKEQCLVWWP